MSDLPKWLIGEDISCQHQFMVHTQTPRFIAEIFDDDEGLGNIIGFPKGEVIWIDEPPLDGEILARLMREAGEALNAYDERNEIEYEKAKILEKQMDEEDPF